MNDFQLEAQRRSIRALSYSLHMPAYVVAENQIANLGSPKLAILPSPQALGEECWSALLKYVEAGGNLLITGPVARDEHQQAIDRLTALGIKSEVEPLVYHNASLKLGDQVIPLEFGQQQQNWLDSLRFADGSTFEEISHGKGRIFWTAYPVELNENLDAVAKSYAYLTGRLKIAPLFSTSAAIPPGVLVFPTVMAASVVYVMVSDSTDAAKVSIHDQLTGAQIDLTLPSQHAAIAVVGKKEKKVVAHYGF